MCNKDPTRMSQVGNGMDEEIQILRKNLHLAPPAIMNPCEPMNCISSKEVPEPAKRSMAPSPAAPKDKATPVTRFVIEESAAAGKA